MRRSIYFAAACAVLLSFGMSTASAEDFFIPGQQRQAASAPAPQAAPRPTPASVPRAAQMAAEPSFAAGPGDADGGPTAPLPPLPPMPELPPVAKANPPPVASVGVIGVPEVMRASIAAQAVDKAIGSRREKLNVSNFDITDEVVTQLNKVLPSVVIPPDGMALSDMPPQSAPVVTPTSGGPRVSAPAPATGPRP